MCSRADIIKTMQDFILEEPSDGYLVKGHSYTYDHYDFEKMGEFANAFDPTNDLTLLYLSDICKWQIGNTTCPMQEVLNGSPHIERYRRCLEIANSPDISFIRETMVKKLSGAVGTVTKQKLIGDGSDIEKALENAIEALFDKFAQLKFEVYLNSGKPVGSLDASSISIQACQSLAECLLRLEKSPDGIYVCYIANPGTLDGWFGFFVKSNGNLFSYNERIDEAYIGQHGNMRNGRYAEGKAYDLFPYELCKASEETDYKGYSKEISIGDNLNLMGGDGNDFSIVMRMLLSMAVIAKHHCGKTIDGDPVIVNSLLPNNLALLENKESAADTTAVVEWQGSPIVEYTAKTAAPVFDVEKVLNGEYNKEFDRQGGCCFDLGGQDVVDAYGKGFTIKKDKILASNSSLRLIGNGKSEQEFIGSQERLRTQAYYEVRGQLRKYLENKMERDFRAFGGAEKLGQWYRERIESRKDTILKYCLEAFNAAKTNEEGRFFGCIYLNSDKDEPGLDSRFDKEYPSHAVEVRVYDKTDMGFWGYFMLSTPSKDRFASKRLCWINGSVASYYFKFDFYDYHQVQDFLGCDLPKFCVGWTRNGWMRANSILNVVDPVSEMVHPLKHFGKEFRFDFAVALSKSAINKMRKEFSK